MVSSKRVGLGFVLMGLLGGCGSSGGSPPPAGAELPTGDPPAASWPSMSGSIDASGGTLTGAQGTVFEGLSLVVPPGALAGPTTITITQSEDPTPLPVGARRIGPQFTIGPSTATLAAPAALTLPASPDEVASYGSQTGDMKVWSLANGAWTRSEPTATADGLVTIALPAFTTVASGVRLAGVTPLCGVQCIVPALSPCEGGPGFCVTNFGTLFPTPEDSQRSFVVSGGYLYWMAGSATGYAAIRRQLDTSSFAGSPQVSGLAAGLAFDRNNPAVRTRDGSYWVGTGATGNVLFGFAGISTRVFTTIPGTGSAGPVLGYGAVQAGSTFAMIANGVGETFDPPRGEFAIDDVSPAVVPNIVTYKALPSPATPGNYVFWTAVAGSGLSVDSRVLTNDLDETDGTVARGIGPTFETTSRVLFADLAPDGSLAVLTRDVNVPDYVAIWKNDVIVDKITLPSPLTVGRFAYDSKGGLWIGSNNTQQVYYRATSGSLTPITLSTASPGSPDAINAFPHRILAGAPGHVLIVTDGNQVFQASFNG